MRMIRALPVLLLALFGPPGAANGQQPAPRTGASQPEFMFTLGTPHLIKEKNAEGLFTIVVPVEAQKPEQFGEPGSLLAYAVLDQPLKGPISDLKSGPELVNLNFDANGKPADMVSSMTSKEHGITGCGLYRVGCAGTARSHD